MRINILLIFFVSIQIFAQNTEIEQFNIKKDIKAKFENKEYSQAEKLVNTLQETDINDGEILYMAGQIYYHLKKWNLAIDYFSRSNSVGFNKSESKYNIACCYALNNQLEEAFSWLIIAINENPSYYYQWQNDTDLIKLKEQSKYLNKLFDYNREAKNTREKWLADIDFFNDRMKQFHYNLFQNISKQEWNEKIVRLKNEVPKLKDYQIIVKLMELASLVGDGHTVVVPPIDGINAFHQAPFLTYLFDDGLYITETSPGYKELLGGKIIKINNISISEVMDKLQKVISHDNEFGIKWLMPLALSMPEVLNTVGIIQNKLEYTVEIENDGMLSSHTIKCNDILSADFLESWLYGFHKLENWNSIESNTLPSYRTKRDVPYWFEFLNESKIVVFHYNQVQTNPEENEEEFMQRLNTFIENNDAKALVIDLRSNEGGDNTIYKPILNGIICNKKINQKGKLFTIIGRRTFSAGMCFATELEKSTNSIFVGEPTGSSPNFVGESGGVFQLPYSGIYANASNLFWQNSYAFDKRKFVTPDIQVNNSFNNYKNGIDKPLQIIIGLIHKSDNFKN